MIDGYMTVAEAAEKLGVDGATISRRLVKLGVEKVGGIYLIDQKTYELISQPGKRGRPVGWRKHKEG